MSSSDQVPAKPTERSADVVVIGGGQAGLSAGHHLLRTGFRPADAASAAAQPDGLEDHAPARSGEPSMIMLDGEGAAGGAWRHRWSSLTMATVNGIADLPDMPLSPFTPQTPAVEAVPAYFDEFERRRSLPIERPVRVTTVVSEAPAAGTGSTLLITSTTGDGEPLPPIRTRSLINATGTWTNPFVPYVPGIEDFAGQQLRTVDYVRAEDLRGRRVGVIGGGISATGFLAELSRVTETRWYTRREPAFREGDFTESEGRAAVARVEERVKEGLPPESVVSVTGQVWSPGLREAEQRGALDRRPMFTRVLPHGVREADGSPTRLDVLLWATGFRAALSHLAPLALRAPGGGIRMEGTQAAEDPRVHLIGYGPSSSTIGANRAGRAAVTALRRGVLAAPRRTAGTTGRAAGAGGAGSDEARTTDAHRELLSTAAR